MEPDPRYRICGTLLKKKSSDLKKTLYSITDKIIGKEIIEKNALNKAVFAPMSNNTV
jgi:hypothetical protein